MTSESFHRTQGLGAWVAPAIMTGCRCETLLQVQAQRAFLTSRNFKNWRYSGVIRVEPARSQCEHAQGLTRDSVTSIG